MAGIMIAAPKSGGGKTMIACGLLALLKRRGWNPLAFKCGPDYIDSLFHQRVLGVESGNLDSFFEEPDHLRRKFREGAKEHFAVVEGVMGYFDGLGGVSSRASSYEIASILELPVILVVDARGASLSLAALIKGFLDFQPEPGKGGGDKRNQLRGIIFNRASRGTYGFLKKLAEERLGVPVVGYVPELDFLKVESRHLGLVLPDEVEGLRNRMERLADCLEESLALDLLGRIAGHGGDVEAEKGERPEAGNKAELEYGKVEGAEAGIREDLETGSAAGREPESKPISASVAVIPEGFTLGIAMDEAFCFYYQDNLELLKQAGARLKYFSPLWDSHLPEGVDGLLFGGGYPENHAGVLSSNTSMQESVVRAAGEGMPMLAECGGYLYLLESLEGADGRQYPMAGVFTGRGYKAGKTGRFGYITVRPVQAQPYLEMSLSVKGHEFHYWDCRCDEGEYIMEAIKPTGGRKWPCMRVKNHVLAGFPHLYYPSCPQLVKEFTRCCAAFGKEGRI